MSTASEPNSERVRGVGAMHELASRVAAGLEPGMVVGLVGELGAGQTELTRGLVRALGVPADQSVCSPSYLLLNLYEGGRIPVAHFDAYFMAGPDDLERAGFADLRRSGYLVVIEWADRVTQAVPEETLWIQIELEEDQDERRVQWKSSAEFSLG